MKRAIFKIGRQINMESQADESGFYMPSPFLVEDWLRDTGTNWTIPIERRGPATDALKVRTRIVISQLRLAVGLLMVTSAFQNKLLRLIRESYPFYLGRYVRILVNEREVEGEDLFLPSLTI